MLKPSDKSYLANLTSVTWMPQSKAQWLGWLSQADELYYGGAAGGGKTDLLLGTALHCHRKAVIFRRVYPSLAEIVDRSIEIVNKDQCFNRTKYTWRLSNCRLEFEACQHEKDKKKQQGRPRDFYGFDEITEFTRSQYLFIIGWNRTTTSGQRCRVICTGNPPTDAAGEWVIDEWQPWLDSEYHDPAQPGELRWYYRDGEQMVWLKSGEPIEQNSITLYPKSRTFIPAKLQDNPFLIRNNEYISVLQSLPEPLRSQMLDGDFSAAKEADPWQVIPTEWIKAAQRRWVEREKPDTPITQVGVDPSRGGADKFVIARRYDNWFDIPKAYPGRIVKDGQSGTTLVIAELNEQEPKINIDVIGIGASVYDIAKESISITPVNNATKSNKRDKSGRLSMRNVRAAAMWGLREALDPQSKEDIALPPGREVLADLCAPRYKVTASGILIESKDEIKKRLGRSPDVGDAIILAHYQTQTGWAWGAE